MYSNPSETRPATLTTTTRDAAHEHAKAAPRLLEGRGFTRLRLVVDLVMLCVSAGVAVLSVSQHDQVWAIALFPPLAVVMLYARGMYKPKIRAPILDGIAPVAGAISIAALVVVAVMVLAVPGSDPGPLMVPAWLAGVALVGTGRVVLAASQDYARRHGAIAKPTLIVGAGVVGAHVARRLEDNPEYGLHPVGFLDADPFPTNGEPRRAPVLGAPHDLAAVAEKTGAKHVIVAFTHASDRELIPLVRRCDELGIEVSLVPRLFESINERIALEHIGGLPLLGLRSVDPQSWQFAVKHAFDRCFSALALFTLAPLLLLLALAVKLSSPGPVLYRQRRVGRDGQSFEMLKFRSMRLAEGGANTDDFALPPGVAPGGVEGQDRRTRIGRLMRRTALDEMPQFINVLRGEMSLIGPRPERPEYVELFSDDVDRYLDRHRVKSGLTGWAQVHGYRGQTSLADRVEWDNYYVDNWSLWLDLKILVMTAIAVLRGDGERY